VPWSSRPDARRVARSCVGRTIPTDRSARGGAA
jgi:hypothetical protein